MICQEGSGACQHPNVCMYVCMYVCIYLYGMTNIDHIPYSTFLKYCFAPGSLTNSFSVQPQAL